MRVRGLYAGRPRAALTLGGFSPSTPILTLAQEMLLWGVVTFPWRSWLRVWLGLRWRISAFWNGLPVCVCAQGFLPHQAFLWVKEELRPPPVPGSWSRPAASPELRPRLRRGLFPVGGLCCHCPSTSLEQRGRVLWTLGCGSQGPDASLVPTLGACVGDALCQGPHRTPRCPPAAT